MIPSIRGTNLLESLRGSVTLGVVRKRSTLFFRTTEFPGAGPIPVKLSVVSTDKVPAIRALNTHPVTICFRLKPNEPDEFFRGRLGFSKMRVVDILMHSLITTGRYVAPVI
jgi:hypothetical protein